MVQKHTGKPLRIRINNRVLTFALIFGIGMLLVFTHVSRGDMLQKIEDRSLVCMLKNRTLGRSFIPVVVDGKTYYGCCEMCTETLQKVKTERFAEDPVTGRKVDKAEAVLGATPDGEVIYFESEKSFREFSRQSLPK